MQVLITPRSYGTNDPTVFRMLEDAGIAYIRNQTGTILTREAIIKLIADCEGVILGIDPMDADVIAAAPRLKAIAKYGVGLDNIDLDAARARGIRVSRTVGANAAAVADYAMALILTVTRRVVVIDRSCRQGDWIKPITQDVNHATLGIVGFGAIGQLLAKRARSFDMRILAYDPYWNAEAAKQLGVEHAEMDELLGSCDILSLHLPLTDQTRAFIGKAQLAQMKPNAVLINTARGGLVDEAALLDALQSGRIGGAGIDAFAEEPPNDNTWFSLDNVVIGSHCAASTVGASRNMGRMATDNLIRDLS